MASVASQLIQEVTAHAQSDSFEDAREICADGTCFPNNLLEIISNTSTIGPIRFAVSARDFHKLTHALTKTCRYILIYHSSEIYSLLQELFVCLSQSLIYVMDLYLQIAFSWVGR